MIADEEEVDYLEEDAPKEVILIIPMYPNMELAAAHTASILAELMDFEEDCIDEIRIAIIETCINSFEHSHSKDQKVYIKFLMKEDEFELRIKDYGVGFNLQKVEEPDVENALKGKQKRGWGLKIIRSLMDEVKVDSSEKGTTITMIKKKT